MNQWRGEFDCYAQELSPTTYYDFFSGEVKDKIPTPLDKLGLVDRHMLIHEMLVQVPEGHNWGDTPRDHHWQWSEERYPYLEGKPNPASFRNLVVNRTILPVSFERRIHHTTLEPDVPDMEVMSAIIDYGMVASELFESAKEIIKWQRRSRNWKDRIKGDPSILKYQNGSDKGGREVNRAIGRHRGIDFGRLRREFKSIDPVFRLVDTDGSPHQVVADLGSLVSKRTIKIAHAA